MSGCNLKIDGTKKSRRIGCVIPRYNLQCGITQPNLRHFWHICIFHSLLMTYPQQHACPLTTTSTRRKGYMHTRAIRMTRLRADSIDKMSAWVSTWKTDWDSIFDSETCLNYQFLNIFLVWGMSSQNSSDFWSGNSSQILSIELGPRWYTAKLTPCTRWTGLRHLKVQLHFCRWCRDVDAYWQLPIYKVSPLVW